MCNCKPFALSKKEAHQIVEWYLSINPNPTFWSLRLDDYKTKNDIIVLDYGGHYQLTHQNSRATWNLSKMEFEKYKESLI